MASFETNGQYVCELEVQGTDGVISFPDPNGFAGPVRMRRAREDWQEIPFAGRGARDARGIGLHELVEATAADRPERASGSSASMSSTWPAASSWRQRRVEVVEIDSRAVQPEAMPVATIV